jgi:CRISPR system Cascade subunit CasA
LLAAGFAMEIKKACAFVETEMPLPALANSAAQERLDRLAAHLVKGAELIASLLQRKVRSALFSPGATVKDSELFSSLRERFWEHTEPAFFALLHQAGARGASDPCPEYPTWLITLRATALCLFDEAAPLEADSGASAAPRIGRARLGLLFALRGYRREGQALFTELGLPSPEQKQPKAKSA